MQFATISEALIIAFLDDFTHVKAQLTTKLFNVSYRKFNSSFKDAARYYCLEQTRFTSHSAGNGVALTGYCKGVVLPILL